MFPVCGNSMKMLKETRFGDHFDVVGEGKTHFGIFEGCGKNVPFGEGKKEEGGGGGGCC